MGVAWVELVTTSKFINIPYSHIKAMAVMKACWADMPYAHVYWGEQFVSIMTYLLAVVVS